MFSINHPNHYNIALTSPQLQAPLGESLSIERESKWYGITGGSDVAEITSFIQET